MSNNKSFFFLLTLNLKINRNRIEKQQLANQSVFCKKVKQFFKIQRSNFDLLFLNLKNMNYIAQVLKVYQDCVCI